MDSRIATIARCTLIEAMRTRLPALVLVTLLALLAASFFIESIAVVEGDRLQTGFYASGMRLSGVFIAAIYVLVSVTREFNDKGLDVLLALDLPRSHSPPRCRSSGLPPWRRWRSGPPRSRSNWPSSLPSPCSPS
jgi:ABC-type transport system involved in multi-copper enzyme maturation permease subunit